MNSTLKDLTGQVFGKLTVIKRAQNSKDNRVCWLCSCECGNQKVIRGKDLSNGKTKSCKQCKFLKPGERFEKLVIVNMITEKTDLHRYDYNCKCDCGKYTIVQGSHLRSGHTTSCGCIRLLNDLTGQRFGNLVVIKRRIDKEYVGTYWICSCDCGNKIETKSDYLTSDGPKSCGCKAEPRYFNLLGKKFGQLTVLKRTEDAWLCLCDCGNEKLVGSGHLVSNHTKSCGCLVFSEDPRLTSAKSTFRNRYSDGNLTEDEFIELSQMFCDYCRDAPANKYNTFANSSIEASRLNGEFIYNGLDRIDNNRKHDRDNVAPCCKHCNYAKRDRTREDFIRHTLKSAAFLCSKDIKNKEVFEEFVKIFIKSE
jgi:hypothetical protein